MLARGTAYRCYATVEEIEAFREQAKAEGRPPLFRSPWRDADPSTWPDAPYVVRLRAPREGETVGRRRGAGPGHLEERDARRPDPAALGRHADLHARRRRRRPRHGRHPRDPRRRPPDQRRAPDADLPGDGLGGAGLRAHPADPRRRRRQALQAPRRARRRRLPRHGLPARGDAQLPGPARLEPRQRRVLHHRRRRSPGSTSAISARRRRDSTSTSSRRCPASTSAPPTTRRCSRRSKAFLQRKRSRP